MSSLIRGLHSSVYARERVENCIVLTVQAEVDKRSLQFNPLYMKVDGAYTVDWGDGAVNSENSHTYTANGTFTVRIKGNIYEIEGGVGPTSSIYVYWIPMLYTSVMVKNVSFNSPCKIRIGRHTVIGSPSGRIEEIIFGENVVAVGMEGQGNISDGLFFSFPKKIRFLTRKCKLNKYAFSAEFDGPEKMNFPDGCSEIPSCCFYGLKMDSIKIPEGVLSLGYSSFYGSTATTVILPSSLTSVSNSFDECTEVTNVYCYANLPPSINQANFGSHPTIHVKASSLSAYANTTWQVLGTLVGDL